ncbi:MAG TPA: DUF929 family protein [Candidatus Dormibacteraeota bacterium]|nr:DUF929 family protein [Candidatus Dormibacteraeota bacterium]
MSTRKPVRKTSSTRAPARKPVSGTPAWAMPAATVAFLALVVGVFLVYRYYTTPPPPPAPTQDTTSQVVSIITTLPSSEFDTIAQGSANNLIKPVSGTTATGATGKPLVLYIGAEYCPFCAAQRWPLIIALSRFGTFSGLQTTTSSSSDVYPNTVTFTFHGATYMSQYIDFRAVETSDRNQNQLETPTAADQDLINRYDSAGTIPFVDFGNRYSSTGAFYSPETIGGMSWLALAESLQQPDSPQAKAVVGSANVITAAICKMSGDQPASVCSTATIQKIEKTLQ